MVFGAFWFAVSSSVAFAAMCVPFINALKDEAPTLYQSLGAPSVSSYFWRRQILMPFSSLILFRGYRATLAPFPRSRAWASWLFVVHWLQVLGFVVFVLSIFR
jgi:hypothetical protein